MGIELIHNKVINRFAWMGLDEVFDGRNEIRFRARITALPMNMACPNIDGANQCLSPIALIFEFSRKRFAAAHGEIVRDTLQGLNAGHFIHAEYNLIGCCLCLTIEFANISNPLNFLIIRLYV